MKSYIKLAAICCIPFLAACEDNLDLYPEDSISENKFFNNVTDLELFANGFYGILPGALGPGADACKKIVDSERYDIYTSDHPEKDYYNLFIQEDLSSNIECIMPRVYEDKLLMHNNTRQLEESYTGMSRAMLEQYLCADGLPTAVSPTYGVEAEMPADELLNIGLSTLDVFIFRYAEVLLNYAEAMAELGKCDDELLDITINKLRDRVGMPHLTAAVGFTDPNWPDYGYELTPLLYEIRRERAVELLGEGFRWDDIVRWKAGKLLENPKTMLGMKVSDILRDKYNNFNRTVNDDGFLVVYPDKQTRKWDNKLYLHPLPIDETVMNPNLLPNNPGWE